MIPWRLQSAANLLWSDIVANQRVLEIGSPIDVDCAGNVAGVVEEDVFVGFDDADILVIQVLLEPVALNQHLRMRVLRAFSIHLAM